MEINDLEKSIKRAESHEAKMFDLYQSPNRSVYLHEERKAKWKKAKLKVEELKASLKKLSADSAKGS